MYNWLPPADEHVLKLSLTDLGDNHGIHLNNLVRCVRCYAPSNEHTIDALCPVCSRETFHGQDIYTAKTVYPLHTMYTAVPQTTLAGIIQIDGKLYLAKAFTGSSCELYSLEGWPAVLTQAESAQINLWHPTLEKIARVKQTIEPEMAYVVQVELNLLLDKATPQIQATNAWMRRASQNFGGFVLPPLGYLRLYLTQPKWGWRNNTFEVTAVQRVPTTVFPWLPGYAVGKFPQYSIQFNWSQVKDLLRPILKELGSQPVFHAISDLPTLGHLFMEIGETARGVNLPRDWNIWLHFREGGLKDTRFVRPHHLGAVTITQVGAPKLTTVE